jgi:glycosyltransferase involved in cell wall biosynthesis
MRILHVLGKLDRGGAETWLVQVLRHVDRQQYQMDFLVHTNEPGAYDDEVRALGSRIIPCLSPSKPLTYARNFRRVLREYGPYDVVHSHVHHYSGYVLMLAAMCGVPVRIAHSHNDTRFAEASASWVREMYLGAMRKLIRTMCTRGLAVSSEAGADLFGERWRILGRWQLQHLGIDLSRFEIEINKMQVRASLGIPEDALVIGNVARFSRQKNHAFLVEIAREVISRHQSAIFLLVGEGELRPAIERKVRACSLQDHFIFAGLRADVPSLMKGAMDVFLFPSLYEGLPITLLEAQAAGLRCLVSNSISKEADVLPDLVRREDLSNSASKWAFRLLDLVSIQAPPSSALLCEALASRSISTSAHDLVTVYAD